ncbi:MULTISPECIES: NAD(P)-dependent oxidoreductase [Agrobacterium]|uniref:NAD(P)-dependent oxidoreductase n=1 Tax=Agrobacterium rubi TaxID=28099 RepID=A0AAE7R7M8_9HYPH|nr:MULTISPECIES: NAD(P)-dependent oxidoreductase [Agrobacterium]MBN7807855.1 NAD(P)-dependent oxidoreductase [Agrobacterium rosae]NTE89815.1 NAD(P)-dependent oxidoreductase [Agrobacterium rubi]NTF05335.1 NAD(P)-dependent oxidoreductase [Agrobacterium rubi]NTF39779.1 NAD(P)-dependent oxidoreductase [Agrobacterium rubi]OCJ44911.1 2-hydroxy-3-oxopropionate reductase [Agrobacterium rubi]
MPHTSRIEPPARVAVLGLGQMGAPMAKNLIAAGFTVAGFDLSDASRQALANIGGESFETASAAAKDADVVITMLPNGTVVRDVLIGKGAVADVLKPGTIVIDMSSSAPVGTVELGEVLRAKDIHLIDCPVSGGVSRAVTGTLAIMAGGDPAAIADVAPVLQTLGKSVFETGRLGSAHALKALNNFVSAAGLVAASEALIIGQKFGLEPETIVDVLNSSTGRNNATEVKLKQFILSGTFSSGFNLALMTKDIATAADLERSLGLELPTLKLMTRLWSEAREKLPMADHTAIYAFLDGQKA